MPGVSDIAVDSTVIDVDRFDPLSTFQALAVEFGEANVAMLESVAGPSHAARTSHILLCPVLDIRVSRESIELSGEEPVVAAASAAAADAGFAVSGDLVSLRERADLWQFLRVIRDLFVNQHDEPTERFEFGLFGYFGYDIAHAIESLPEVIPRSSDLPDAVLSVHSAHVEVEVATGRARLAVHRAPGFFDAPDRDAIVDALSSAPPSDLPDAPQERHVVETISRERYLDKVLTAQEHISAGDIYQVQIGHELQVHTDIAPFDVYQRLRARNPSPYMFFGNFGDLTIAGASPEICVRVVGSQVCIRPIAGTIRRGESPEEDFELVNKMLSDEKEIAEHVMLVDLGRNDVGRVCKPKTMGVDELMVIEQYSHVSHIVSNVVGTMRDDVDTFDAIAASFPAGTVTGAPKVRAMEIIESLESTQRGFYGGAVGLIDFGGYCITSLGLRSTTYRDGVYRLRASAGIVADSKPENEWRETLSKMAAPFWATTGKEIASAGLGG